MRIIRSTRNIAKLLTLLVIVLTITILLFVFIWKADPIHVATEEETKLLQTGNFPWVTQKLVSLENSPLEFDLASNAISGSAADVLNSILDRISAIEHRFAEEEHRRYLSQPVINNFTFSYLHNAAERCEKSQTNILIVVRSNLIHFKKRQEIRNGVIGEYVRDLANEAKLLFFIGQISAGKFYKAHQKSIRAEATANGDVVQGDFEDSNNPFKSISMLRWPTMFCHGIKYIIRSDDDNTFNPTALISVLKRKGETMDTFIVGSQAAEDPLEIAKKNGIHLTPEDIEELPSSILGVLQGFSAKTNRMLYEAALRVKPVWLEDIFVNSVCAKKMSISVVNDPAFS